MEKRTAGIVGAIASIATMGAANAAVHPGPTQTEIMQPSSYAELLQPIPNAVAILQASNAALLQNAQTKPGVLQVQYDNNGGNSHHHHHHHHHQVYVPPEHHHHHHHHHHNGGLTVLIP